VAPEAGWFPRIIACVFVALTTLLLGWVARQEFGPGSGWTAMWLVTPMILLPGLEQFTANTEMFLILPLLGTTAIYVVARERSTAWHWLTAGFLAAVTLLYKFTVFPLLAFVFVAWSYEQWKKERATWTLMKSWLSGAVGGLLASILALAFFLKTDGGNSLWDCVVRFNRHYASSNQFDCGGAEFRLGAFWSAWWFLFLLPLALIRKSPPRIVFWLAMTVLAFACGCGSYYGHYYIPTMVFCAVLDAAAVNALVAWFPVGSDDLRDWIRRGIVGVVVVLICLPNASRLVLSKREFQAGAYPYLDYPAAAKQLAEMTSPDDFVLFAGSEPQILSYAKRRSSTRFVLMYPLMIPTPLAASYQLEALDELKERPPAAIVLARRPESWIEQPASPTDFQRYVASLLQTDYELVGGFAAEHGSWQSPLPDTLVPSSEMQLFRRRKP